MSPRFTFTDTSHGDMSGLRRGLVVGQARPGDGLPSGPWTWLDQVHGAEVVVVDSPGGHAGARADAAVAAAPGVAVAVLTADCGPLVLVADGAVAVVHVGWRGLMAGVVAEAVEALADLGTSPGRAVLGPTIAAHHYEFDPEGIDAVERRFGPEVRATSAWGSPALDLPAAIASAVAEHGLALEWAGVCTACSATHWSHRERADTARQALVAWVEP